MLVSGVGFEEYIWKCGGFICDWFIISGLLRIHIL